MPEKKKTIIFVISDSIGETAYNLVQATVAQFPEVDFEIQQYPLVRTSSLLSGILKRAKRVNAIIVHTLVIKNLSEQIDKFCQENSLQCLGALERLLDMLEKQTKVAPRLEPGMNHHTDKDYFKRIECMEFAVTYDDGKDPSGFTQADIVLLGVSRTSKTPLSLYLANKGYKVANLPLVPKTKIPDEIYEIDQRKIFGLTNDPAILNSIRRQRMVAYGLDPDSHYSNLGNINNELKFAQELYHKLGCLVINTANKSIEETATLIIESLNERQNPTE
ncbi:pyruvate, phosphate dikinase/phosphoenolpyruvate synthase regulator [Ligilactobacillus pobuzihii]|uniref:pyruvate, water dikinase regulatory protein n=1 Tax=Ligilactobacillus pobuzihii TaxID=449659 RepID=UPI0019D1F761|nr:pyruvate, water dikinase regulatory protein [Ligilactobacillus pobuzihii]MBN7273612.1 pyruvate, phosphate dikinase/phosphoenolpyruvate synthase regulator [Ligilactobacillus pobuzihii]HIZ95448.1 kinase/pyrophosphorylase [Candidatus Ligilactobacillus excrementavium]